MEDQQSFRGNDNPLGYLYVEKSILSEFERIFLCQRYSYPYQDAFEGGSRSFLHDWQVV